MNKFIDGYRCSLCGEQYTLDKIDYVCPIDGGNLDIVYDYNNIAGIYSPKDIFLSQDTSLWRYLPLLPVSNPEASGTPLASVGGTPVYSPNYLAKKLGVKHLWIKDESRNPTASFKDRASAVVITRAREIGAEVVVTASTGNAGAALAGMAAAVNHKAVIFAPRSAPPAKIAQLLVYGAQVILVDGTYDDAFDLTIQAAQEFGWYCRNTGYNPFTTEGKKTAAYEIWEYFSTSLQKTPGNRALNIFVSVGDGNIISGIHKGYKDLAELGWLELMPKIYGIQAEGSAAIANAFFNRSEQIIPVKANTLADSISVDLPRDGVRAVRAATETGGQFITVSDQEILIAIRDLGNAGIFAEPAGATSYAGLVKAVNLGLINLDDPLIVLNTGSGLKDVKAAMQAVDSAPVIEPSIDAVKKMIK